MNAERTLILLTGYYGTESTPLWRVIRFYGANFTPRSYHQRFFATIYCRAKEERRINIRELPNFLE